jgi:hypothetical protein
MAKIQKIYTQQFKREAVRLAQTNGKPITHGACELGISDTSSTSGARSGLNTASKPFQAVDIKLRRKRRCANSNVKWNE